MALSQIGVPYAYGGASPDTGFDCSGLVAFAYRNAHGIEVPRTTFSQARLGHPVGVADLQPGDLVFYNTLRREYSHVGIYLGDGRFVHAPTTGGVVRVEDMRGRFWTERFNGARRFSL